MIFVTMMHPADKERKGEMDGWVVAGGKSGNVRTITVAARKRLIKWHLAQRASAPCSWWRREKMGFDSGERERKRESGGSWGCDRNQ